MVNSEAGFGAPPLAGMRSVGSPWRATHCSHCEPAIPDALRDGRRDLARIRRPVLLWLQQVLQAMQRSAESPSKSGGRMPGKRREPGSRTPHRVWLKEAMMALKDVRIVELRPMRVASSLGFGTQPEDRAARQIYEFAKSIGIDPKSEAYRTYGFNNPSPCPGSDRYGYEIWLPVGPDVKAEGPIQIKQVPRGRYAVTRFTGLSNIGRVWMELVAWFEDSPYTCPPNGGQCLEVPLNHGEPDPEKWVFDLYLPIAS